VSEHDRTAAPPDLDLRSFRERLTPSKTLGQVALGARVDKSLLSKLEQGKRPVTAACARRLARFYSRVTGSRVTAGHVVDMVERAAGRHAPQLPTDSLSGAMEVPDLSEECSS
jgi:helix-turn-helix protein